MSYSSIRITKKEARILLIFREVLGRAQHSTGRAFAYYGSVHSAWIEMDGWMNRWAFSLPVDKSYVENKSGGAVGTALHDTTRRDAMRCDTQDESRFLSCRHGPVVYSSSSRPVVIVRLGNSDATAAADVPQPTAT